MVFVSSIWMNQKRDLLEENTESITRNVSNMLSSDYLSQNGRNNILVICNTLMQMSDAVDADFFIVNTSGDVVYCKEILQTDKGMYNGTCVIHDQYRIPSEIMETMKTGTKYNKNGTLDGLLTRESFIVGCPIIVDNGDFKGAVFATQAIAYGLMPYISTIFRMFFLASMMAFLLSFAIVYLVSYRLTKPLREMSVAVKQYAVGDFSARISVNTHKSRFSHLNEIDELVSAFNSMASDLSSLESSRKSFVSNVSHELKTPMTSIGGFIDGILDGTIEPEKQKQYLLIVSDEVKRLSRLVTGMLNMSKIEAGQLDINPVKFDISEMIFTTLLSFEQTIEKRHIEVRGLETISENIILADKDMINQVIYNLVDNAVKFTPDNGYIEVTSKADSEKVIVKIKNSGKGIEAEDLSKIFERFYKVDRSRSYDVKGAGMGLFIVKSLIELHGGSIVARSEVGEYTEFIFFLPVS